MLEGGSQGSPRRARTSFVTMDAAQHHKHVTCVFDALWLTDAAETGPSSKIGSRLLQQRCTPGTASGTRKYRRTLNWPSPVRRATKSDFKNYWRAVFVTRCRTLVLSMYLLLSVFLVGSSSCRRKSRQGTRRWSSSTPRSHR